MSSGTFKPPAPRLRRCYVLDEDEGLARRVPPGIRPVARQLATAAVVLLPVGEQPLQRWYGAVADGGAGMLVLRGAFARAVHVAGRTATEIFGPGDLIRPWDVGRHESVPREIAWTVLVGAELALLNEDFATRTRLWPEIFSALLARAEQRAEGLAVQRAIASHPRVDMRVAMLLWHLAGRYGVVQPDGSVRLDLPLTHRLLGELAGAERPSVSHALGRLTRAGLVARDRQELTLFGTPAAHEEAATRPLEARL